MQGSGYGLQMRVRDMAKIGQLYLQEGMSAPSTQLLSAEYVAASMEMKVGPWPNWPGVNWMSEYCDDPSNVRLEGYGYQWWKMTTSDDLKYTCAIGHGGQFICIYPRLDVVVALTTDSSRSWGSSGYRASCLVLALIPGLSEVSRPIRPPRRVKDRDGSPTPVEAKPPCSRPSGTTRRRRWCPALRANPSSAAARR